MTVTTLGYTGTTQTYSCPAGVTYLTIECWGAEASGPYSGNGGYAKGQLIVAPGTVLTVVVGGSTSYNGGGVATSGGNPGGGASDVRLGGGGLGSRVIVAGGGGGRGAGVYGGAGGYGGGASGHAGLVGLSNPGGAPGTQTGGYALGAGEPGHPGISGGVGGGGGGGGYYGGRCGGSSIGASNDGAGGGGGGSSFLSSLLVAGGTTTSNTRTGNGQVVITAVSAAPLAPTPLTPSNNGYIVSPEANTFTWVHNNLDPGGYQSKADFQWKKAGDAGWTQVLACATTVSSYTLPAAAWTVGFQYEWQARTYGAGGLASPWSASSFTNTIASVPAPTITVPTSGALEFATPVELDWTLPGGFTADAYQVQRTDLADGSGVVYYDSGTVVTAGPSALVPLDAAAGRTDWLRVRFRYNGHWSAWAAVDILCEFGPPAVPMVVAAQVSDVPPEVSVAITNPAAALGFADTIVVDLYRTSPDGSKVRIGANLAPNSTYLDPWPTAGTNIYTAVAFAASGASAESY